MSNICLTFFCLYDIILKNKYWEWCILNHRRVKDGLNRREKSILKYISKQIEKNGYPPSVREIGKAVGLSSTATVHGYLARLE